MRRWNIDQLPQFWNVFKRDYLLHRELEFDP